MYEYFTSRGLIPKYEVLDNEISNELIVAMKKYDITFQLTPPTFIDQTLQNERYERGKITSYQSFAASILHPPSNCGTSSLSKQM